MSDLIKAFGRIGVKANEASQEGESVVAHLTPTQYEKLAEVVGQENAALVGIDSGKVVVRVKEAALNQAIAENRTAVRRSAVNFTIHSSMVYNMRYEPDSEPLNKVVYGEWNGSEGTFTVETEADAVYLKVLTANADEFYEDADSDRKVFLVSFIATDADTGDSFEDVLVSYGVTNLIRRVVSYSHAITANNTTK